MKVIYDRDRRVLGAIRKGGEVTEIPDYVADEHIAEGIAKPAQIIEEKPRKKKGGALDE